MFRKEDLVRAWMGKDIEFEGNEENVEPSTVEVALGSVRGSERLLRNPEMAFTVTKEALTELFLLDCNIERKRKRESEEEGKRVELYLFSCELPNVGHFYVVYGGEHSYFGPWREMYHVTKDRSDAVTVFRTMWEELGGY